MRQQSRQLSAQEASYSHSPRQLDGDLAERFQLVGKLGEGSFGTVIAVLDKKTNIKYALKKVKLQKKDEGVPVSSLRQIILLKSLHHPNIIKVQEVFYELDEPQQLSFLLQLHPCNLYDYIKQKHPINIKKIQVILSVTQQFSYQLFSGLSYMHRRRIMHRDIKSHNLLISKSGVLKICDLGQAKIRLVGNCENTTDISTLWYRAPEMLLGTKVYNEKIDVWAAGCIMTEMILGKPIFKARSELGMLVSIFQLLGTPKASDYPQITKMADFSASFPKFQGGPIVIQPFSEAGVDLLRKLLVVNPQKRLSMEQALRHQFFHELPNRQREPN